MIALRLALAYLRFHWVKSLVLVLAIALIVAAPLAVSRLIEESEARMTARAEATPLLLGARGSRLDLVMSALYFTDDPVDRLSMVESEAVQESGFAAAIPLHRRFTTEGAPIVGAPIDYFDFRGLTVAEGRGLALLGEAALGATVAERLGLSPGDAVVSTPTTLFDLAGVYPLRMPVVGVLAPSGSPDDDAVFVSLETAWVIEGIGHGHQDVAPVPEGPAAAAQAEAELVRYAEITPENVDSFHFHGDPGGYPVDAVIVAPRDDRAATILRGRYLDAEGPAQLVEPAEVVVGLFERVFRLKRVLDAVVLVVGAAALLAVGLALFMSLQLRRGEMAIAYRLGAGRGAIARLVAAEAAILFFVAIGLALLANLAFEGIAAPVAAWLIASAA